MDQLKAGKPLAAQGLELMPRRPQFTRVVMLTASPANPLCEIRFQRNGRPLSAQILEGSGDPRVDEAILSSLYRWRAKGKELLTLKARETKDIRIRIVLSRR
ncbi:MAG: energy transducer TonB [Planctomycetota bacterium]|jgi:hypothetical protein